MTGRARTRNSSARPTNPTPVESSAARSSSTTIRSAILSTIHSCWIIAHIFSEVTAAASPFFSASKSHNLRPSSLRQAYTALRSPFSISASRSWMSSSRRQAMPNDSYAPLRPDTYFALPPVFIAARTGIITQVAICLRNSPQYASRDAGASLSVMPE